MVIRCHSLSFVVTRCHSLPLAVIRCHSCHSLYHPLSLVVSLLYHSLSFVVTRCHSLSLVVIRCHSCHSLYQSLYHSLSFVVTRCTTRCHSLSLDGPLVCLFIKDRLYVSLIISYNGIFFKMCLSTFILKLSWEKYNVTL